MKDEMICYCRNVKRSEIVRVIKDGAKSLKDVQQTTKACTGNRCSELNPKGRCCYVDVIEILKEFDIDETGSSCCKCNEECC